MKGMGMLWKLWLPIAVAVLVSVPILTFLLGREIRMTSLKYTRSNLSRQAELVGELIRAPLVRGDTEEIGRLIKKMGKNTRITLFGADGLVLVDSQKGPAKMKADATQPEILAALQGRVGTAMREGMLYVTVPVKEDGRILGVVRTGLPRSKMEGILGRMKQKAFYFSLILILFLVLYALVAWKVFVQPLRKTVIAVRRMGDGDFTPSAITHRRDELGELAVTLNRVGQGFQKSLSEVTSEKEELQAIFASMMEAVVVLDGAGRVLLANERFKQICGLDPSEDISQRWYWEVLRSVEFKECIDRVRKSAQAETVETEWKDDTYLVNATPFSPPGKGMEIAVVFHDITEIKRLEMVKADFVANVSHELRTPLTAIKGFVETLEEEGTEGERRYLTIIRRHTDRLISLVSDLLLLSELEYRGLKVEMEEVDLGELVANVLKIYEDQMQEKGLRWSLRLSNGQAVIQGDPFLLEQLLINLLDNAVKYTQEGEIRVSLSPSPEGLKLEVSDTGVGIAREHLARIFERFYRVDKARSRQLGGTGLGLSIVKHIAHVHGGTVTVKSELGKGSKFTVTLPLPTRESFSLR